MKNKIKYLILILVLMIIPIITLVKEVNADYLNIIILDNGNIEELPDEETQNIWNINKYVYATYDYKGTKQYLLNYYSTTTNYNIFYTTNKFTNESYLEIEDDAYSVLLDNDLTKLLNDLNTTIKQIDPNISNLPRYYINFDFHNMIAYYDKNIDNYVKLYVEDYEQYYTNYINNYGILNSIYQQNNLYQYIINYYENIIEIDGNTYQKGIEESSNYYKEQIQELNTIWENKLQENQENYYENGFEDGRVYEREHPQDTINYDLKYLFGVVSLYPINFFTNGMNVNLFGINLGNLILGIFMIALIIIIIRMIITIIRGGK